ncbi:MAG: efflux RND transporter permease subunit, partial [Acidimicrobiales bacterium]
MSEEIPATSPGGSSTPTGRSRFNVTALSIRRPVTVLMVLGFLVVAGAVAFTKLPVRRLPNVNFPYVRVVIGDVGVSASTVSETITTPVEKALSSQSGVVSMVGTSAPGRSTVALQFAGGTNVDQAAASIS